jgi:flagellar basal body rod protein FlgC
MFECKGKFGERTGEKPVRSTLLSDFEKVADEAYANDRDPALALRFYKPDSPLANEKGYVDLTVRLMSDDAQVFTFFARADGA